MKLLLFVLLGLALLVRDVQAAPFTLAEGYDKSIIPMQTEKDPLQMTGSMNLRSIFEINEKDQTITVESTLMFAWKDNRITVNEEELNGNNFIRLGLGKGKDADKIWIPDIIIDKVVRMRSPAFIKDTSSIRLYKDGEIRYATRKNYDMACGMDFQKFPFDIQTCNLIIHSFGSSTKDFTLKWRGGKENQIVNPNITKGLAQFQMETNFIDDWDLRDFGRGHGARDLRDLRDFDIDKNSQSYPGLILEIKLYRMLTYYRMQLFIPSGLFVLTAWATMFFPTTTPGIRAQYNVQITNLITMWTMNNGIQAIVPKTSYLTYADYWLQSCFTFIFVFITVLIVFCALQNTKKPKVVSVAKYLNRWSRQVAPLFIVIFTLGYFLVANDVI